MDAWAIVEHSKPLQKVQLSLPQPAGSEVLIKVTHSGICHSDLHIWEGYYDLGDGKKFRMADRGLTLPHALGHEVVGDVAKLGPDAKGPVVGDRRIIFPWIGCGACSACGEGDENLCGNPQSIGTIRQGGMASYVLVKDPRYLIDPGELDPAVACTFACSGTTVMSAIRRLLPLQMQRPLLVIGAGGLGLTAIAILKALGHRRVICADVHPRNREASIEAGAIGAVDSSASDALQRLLCITKERFPAVLDCVSVSGTATLGFAALAKGGKLVSVGLMGGELKLSLVALVAKAATIMGNSTGNLEDLIEVTRLAQEGSLSPIPIKTMPRDQAMEALEMLRDGKVTGRLVLAA
jgi:alcohol dehydrogenase, propanol-preferring